MQINTINNFYYKNHPYKNNLKNNTHFLQNYKNSNSSNSSKKLDESGLRYDNTHAPLIKQFNSSSNQILLRPIKTYEKYVELLRKVLNYTESIDSLRKKKAIFIDGYECAPVSLMGLVPYCGQADKSKQINEWLSGRKVEDTKLSKLQIANIVRVLEYSLKILDEQFGTYKGVVYRAGYFNPNTDNQYYSSSFGPDCTAKHILCKSSNNNTNYSIIKVKNGHNIYDFQKLVNSFASNRYASNEKEILLDRKSKFRLIPKDEYTQEELDLEINFIAMSLGTSYLEAKKLFEEENDYGIVKNISIWEEI